MASFLKRFFRQKETKGKLEKAVELGLITEEEFLRLQLLRAEDKLKDFVKRNEPKPRRRRI